MDVEGERVDLVAWDVEERERGDVMEVLGRVVGLKRVHDDGLPVDSETITNTSRQELENLAC